MRIAVDQSWPYDIGLKWTREGIFVYNKFLFDALLEYDKHTSIEFWFCNPNKAELMSCYGFLAKKYPGRVFFIDSTGTFSLKKYFLKTKYRLKKKLYRLLSKITKNKKYDKKIAKYKNKQKEAEQVNYEQILNKKIINSKADIAFLDAVLLKGMHQFKRAKVCMVHDLYGLQLQKEYEAEYGIAATQKNQNTIDNLRKYASEGAYFITSAKYTRDYQLLKFIDNIRHSKTKVISFPPFIKKIHTENVPDREDFLRQYGLPQVYIAYPSQNRWNKNLIVLLKALKRLKEQNTPILLATTGKINFVRSCARFVIENNLTDVIKELPYLPENHLYALYKYSSCVVVPTYIEGFGMTGQCLEALSVNCSPIIHAKSYGMKESLASVGLSMKEADLNWFELDDDISLANKIEQAIKKPKDFVKKHQKILKHYTRITWQDVAKQYHQYFEEIINAKSN